MLLLFAASGLNAEMAMALINDYSVAAPPNWA
jgi:hypothetical protein